NFEPGDILVVPGTNAEFVEMMRKASGIITEESSLTSHAAVIGLRLGVPVIVDFKAATANIREGAIITVDAEKGQVYSGLVMTHQNGDQ
ncbi:MAG: PEP-utilizing enzyme, partial [Crocosphaera sp.]